MIQGASRQRYLGRSKCLLTAKSQYLSKILNAQCQHDRSIEAHGNACAVWQAGFQRVEKSIVLSNHNESFK